MQKGEFIPSRKIEIEKLDSVANLGEKRTSSLKIFVELYIRVLFIIRCLRKSA